jgi:hypothetical protein
VKWPWKREIKVKHMPAETGGREARERAEEALRDVRERRSRVLAIRTVLLRDLEQNHYRDSVAQLFRGGNA